MARVCHGGLVMTEGVDRGRFTLFFTVPFVLITLIPPKKPKQNCY
jgi:hypothetical protein